MEFSLPQDQLRARNAILGESVVTEIESSFQRVDNWYSGISFGMSCRYAIQNAIHK